MRIFHSRCRARVSEREVRGYNNTSTDRRFCLRSIAKLWEGKKSRIALSATLRRVVEVEVEGRLMLADATEGLKGTRLLSSFEASAGGQLLFRVDSVLALAQQRFLRILPHVIYYCFFSFQWRCKLSAENTTRITPTSQYALTNVIWSMYLLKNALMPKS